MARYSVGNAAALGTQTGGVSIDLGDSNPITGSLTHYANNVALLANSGLSIANQIYVDTNTSGSTRTIGSDGTSGGVTFSGNVLLAGSAILTAAAGGDVTFSGTLGPSGFTTGGITKTGAGMVTLTNANGYTGGTTINAGTLVAGNNSAFGSMGAQTVTFNGGKLASDSDARSLSNNLVVNNVAGNRITGNSLTLTGAASGAGTLEVAVSAGKSVTVNSGTANGFAPAAIKVTTGTLLLGGDNKLGNATNLQLAGGTFATGGFSQGSAGAEGLGALTLSATSTLDFGNGASVLRFAGIAQSVADTVLMIVNWTGTGAVPGGTDRLLFTGSSTDFISLFNQNEVSFNGISGYNTSDLGGFYEVTAVPEPATFVGALCAIGLIGYRDRRRILNAMKWKTSGAPACSI